jgi:hypothetical protein
MVHEPSRAGNEEDRDSGLDRRAIRLEPQRRLVVLDRLLESVRRVQRQGPDVVQRSGGGIEPDGQPARVRWGVARIDRLDLSAETANSM